MFKFIEDKRFFYACAALSIVVTVMTANLRSYSVVSVFGNVLIVIFLLAMIIFNRVEHKELMKVLTASLLEMIIVKNLAEFSAIAEPIFSNLQKVTDVFNINNITFRGVTLIITSVLLLILFVNHFVINFTGKASKVAINVNKVAMVIYFIIIVITKIVLVSNIYRYMPLFSSMPSKLKLALIIDGIPTMLYALSVVSMEAFVNKERAKKGKLLHR
jgi:hypothetical protein